MYCPNNIDTASYKDNLVACQTHCERVGANRLTFYPTNLCRCCTASSRLNPDITGKVYTHTGKYMYFPASNWYRNTAFDFPLLLFCKCFAYVHSIVYLENKDYGLDFRLIPQSNQTDCPTKAIYRERFSSCSCGSYCSWDLCRTKVAPTECLVGAGSEWKWDILKNAWVAQIVNGITSYLTFLSIFQFTITLYDKIEIFLFLNNR